MTRLFRYSTVQCSAVSHLSLHPTAYWISGVTGERKTERFLIPYLARANWEKKKKLVSPFTFTEISRNQRREKDKLSGKKWWERETHEKKNLCFLSHSFFFSTTGGKN